MGINNTIIKRTKNKQTKPLQNITTKKQRFFYFRMFFNESFFYISFQPVLSHIPCVTFICSLLVSRIQSIITVWMILFADEHTSYYTLTITISLYVSKHKYNCTFFLGDKTGYTYLQGDELQRKNVEIWDKHTK